jgi:hypothetical protein
MMEMFYVGSEANLAIGIDPRYEKYHTLNKGTVFIPRGNQFLY